MRNKPFKIGCLLALTMGVLTSCSLDSVSVDSSLIGQLSSILGNSSSEVLSSSEGVKSSQGGGESSQGGGGSSIVDSEPVDIDITGATSTFTMATTDATQLNTIASSLAKLVNYQAPEEEITDPTDKDDGTGDVKKKSVTGSYGLTAEIVLPIINVFLGSTPFTKDEMGYFVDSFTALVDCVYSYTSDATVFTTKAGVFFTNLSSFVNKANPDKITYLLNSLDPNNISDDSYFYPILKVFGMTSIEDYTNMMTAINTNASLSSLKDQYEKYASIYSNAYGKNLVSIDVPDVTYIVRAGFSFVKEALKVLNDNDRVMILAAVFSTMTNKLGTMNAALSTNLKTWVGDVDGLIGKAGKILTNFQLSAASWDKVIANLVGIFDAINNSELTSLNRYNSIIETTRNDQIAALVKTNVALVSGAEVRALIKTLAKVVTGVTSEQLMAIISAPTSNIGAIVTLVNTALTKLTAAEKAAVLSLFNDFDVDFATVLADLADLAGKDLTVEENMNNLNSYLKQVAAGVMTRFALEDLTSYNEKINSYFNYGEEITKDNLGFDVYKTEQIIDETTGEGTTTDTSVLKSYTFTLDTDKSCGIHAGTIKALLSDGSTRNYSFAYYLLPEVPVITDVFYSYNDKTIGDKDETTGTEVDYEAIQIDNGDNNTWLVKKGADLSNISYTAYAEKSVKGYFTKNPNSSTGSLTVSGLSSDTVGLHYATGSGTFAYSLNEDGSQTASFTAKVIIPYYVYDASTLVTSVVPNWSSSNDETEPKKIVQGSIADIVFTVKKSIPDTEYSLDGGIAKTTAELDIDTSVLGVASFNKTIDGLVYKGQVEIVPATDENLLLAYVELEPQNEETGLMYTFKVGDAFSAKVSIMYYYSGQNGTSGKITKTLLADDVNFVDAPFSTESEGTFNMTFLYQNRQVNFGYVVVPAVSAVI